MPPCPGTPDGCTIDFEDTDFETGARDAVYYARAIEESSPAINADNLGCVEDEAGDCIRVEPCREGPCTAEDHPRAWSSPIFVDWGGEAAGEAETAIVRR